MPAPLVDDEPALGPAPRVARRGVPLAYVAGGVLGLVVVVGLLVAFLWKGQSLIVTPKVDAQGHEELHLTCDSCPDDTTAQLGGVKAPFHGKEADLPLAAPLKVGDNPLTISLDRPGLGRDEDVRVTVPVDFRIKPDLAALGGAHPAIVVRVQAVAGSVVRVDDKPVSLDANGEAASEIDVSGQTSGWSDEVRSIERSIPYVIVTPARPERPAAEQRGNVAVRAKIPLLHLDAPGLSPVIESATYKVAGRTKDASVTINGQPVTTNPDGTFAQSYDAPDVGEFQVEVRADGPQLAARTAHLTVKRVAHLADEARSREAAPWVGYDAILQDAKGSVGKATIVEGDVAKTQSGANQVIAIIDDRRGCGRPPGGCLVRVVYGGDEPLVDGAHLRVFGQVTGVLAASAGGTAPVPVVTADFAVKGRAGRR